ncbi:uncharacterized protein TNCV_2956991 [Trichonephila clavipes]|nr:uncharacterized protein TNCV_2956991 [Trichonephila clavipes]
MNGTEQIHDGASTSAAGAVEIMQAEACACFTTTFVNNTFGHKCDVCDRLRFLRSLKPAKEKLFPLLTNTSSEEPVADFKLCAMCKNSLDSEKGSTLPRSNRFVYPPKQQGLPALDPISARLVSLRLSFKQIRWLRRH